jgi:transcriptional regulator with XRE-family HTH domain
MKKKKPYYDNSEEHNMRVKILTSILDMKGITVSDFADFVGVHKTVVSSILNGKRELKVRELDYWCKCIGCLLTVSLVQDFKKKKSKYLKAKEIEDNEFDEQSWL